MGREPREIDGGKSLRRNRRCAAVRGELTSTETRPGADPRICSGAGELGGSMPIKTMIEAIRDALDVEMERDPRVFVMGEDVGSKGGVFLATDGLYKKYGPKRLLDTP